MCEAAIGLDSNRAQENRRWTRQKAGALRDLALQSLSQEAVRDEALEEKMLIRRLASLEVTESEIEQDSKYGPRVIFEKGGTITVSDVLMARRILRALKREPNNVLAPGERKPGETHEGTAPQGASALNEGSTLTHAVAATPDVVEMVKRHILNCAYQGHHRDCSAVCGPTPDNWYEDGACDCSRKEVLGLLGKLGQKDEECWLIERFVNDHVEFFCGWYKFQHVESEWKLDAFQAIRFSRKEDAEAIMRGQEGYFYLAKPVAHVWFIPPAPGASDD
jgi:hypothetical protein